MNEQIKWSRKVPLLNNSYMVMDMLFVLLAGGGGLGVILILIMGVDEIFMVLKFVTYTLGIVFVISFLTMGVVLMNNVEMIYTLTKEGISTDMGKREGKMNKVALLVGTLAGKPGVMGSSMMSMSRESTFIEWGRIEKARLDGKKKVISLSSGKRMLVRLYCDPEVYSEAAEYVEAMLPDADLKHI